MSRPRATRLYRFRVTFDVESRYYSCNNILIIVRNYHCTTYSPWSSTSGNNDDNRSNFSSFSISVFASRYCFYCCYYCYSCGRERKMLYRVLTSTCTRKHWSRSKKSVPINVVSDFRVFRASCPHNNNSPILYRCRTVTEFIHI